MALIRTRSVRDNLLLYAGVVGAVVASNLLRVAIEIPGLGFGTYWPMTGFFAGCLLATERRHWLPITAIFFVVDFFILFTPAFAGGALTGFLGSATYFALVAAGCWVLRLFHPNGLTLDRILPDLRDFLIAAAAIAVLTAIHTSIFLAAARGEPIDPLGWQSWVFFDIASLVITVPVILTWVSPPTRRRNLRSLPALAEFAAVLGLLLIILATGQYGAILRGQGTFDFIWVPVLWSLFRFDLRIVTLLMLVATCGISMNVPATIDVAVEGVRQATAHVHTLAAYMTTAVSVTLILNALFSGGRKLQDEFERLQKYASRLAEAVGCIVWVFNTDRQRFDFRASGVDSRWGGFQLARGNDDWIESVHPDDVHDVGLLWRKMRRGEIDYPLSVDFRATDKEDNVCWLRGVCVPVPPMGDGGKRYVGITFDITSEREALTEKDRLSDIVFESEKLHAVGALAAGMAHDWNNLLTVMSMQAGAIRDHVGDSREIAEDLEMLGKVIQDGQGITNQLLELARRDQGEVIDCNLRAEIGRAREILARTLPRNVNLRARIDGGGDIAVRCKPIHLSQIILNLGLNGRDAIGEKGGTVSIEVDGPVPGEIGGKRQDVAMVRISDNGNGMPAEELNRIFEPLFTTKGARGGSGLGLTVVRNLVEGMDGKIEVESEFGAGTRVLVTLPVVTSETAEEVSA